MNDPQLEVLRLKAENNQFKAMLHALVATDSEGSEAPWFVIIDRPKRALKCPNAIANLITGPWLTQEHAETYRVVMVGRGRLHQASIVCRLAALSSEFKALYQAIQSFEKENPDQSGLMKGEIMSNQ